ncbi:VIT family-domain-containing protein [Bisporella sp. PMI_857]|nr:VIT family-domain-containing protein [Bisporella sp. PMI_857]
MSLVAIKNIFFPRTKKSISRRASNEERPLDCNEASTQPLLQSSRNNSWNRLSQASINSDTTDVEAQCQDQEPAEKTASSKGFKVDARVVSDATIGLSDGLTVPFALTAGLSALGNTKVVIYGGFAELIAGAISMGLGGYLGAKSELASYEAQRDETQEMIDSQPEAVQSKIVEVFEPYELPPNTLKDITHHLTNSPQILEFMMRFQHCQEQPDSSRALTAALTIALAYFLGGLLPLIPYFCVDTDQVTEGLYISIVVMVIALFVFGYVKHCVVVGWEGGRNVQGGCYGGIQMVVVGGIAAAAAMGLVRLFNQGEGSVTGA